MKNKENILLYLPAVISLFLPLLTIVMLCFGYSVTLFNYTVCSVIYALIFLFSAWLNLRKEVSKINVFLPIFSLFNLIIYVYKSKSAVVFICMAVCFVYSAIIAKKSCRCAKQKIASVLTSAFFSVPVFVVSLVVVTFGAFSMNTVVDKIYSPNKTYFIEIIDSDQGALGGNTVVYVHQNRKLDLFVLTISKTPERIYIGEWKEYETMNAEWESENSLLIDSAEYNIKL